MVKLRKQSKVSVSCGYTAENGRQFTVQMKTQQLPKFSLKKTEYMKCAQAYRMICALLHLTREKWTNWQSAKVQSTVNHSPSPKIRHQIQESPPPHPPTPFISNTTDLHAQTRQYRAASLELEHHRTNAQTEEDKKKRLGGLKQLAGHLLVKSSPRQKLPTQSRRAHLLDTPPPSPPFFQLMAAGKTIGGVFPFSKLSVCPELPDRGHGWTERRKAKSLGFQSGLESQSPPSPSLPRPLPTAAVGLSFQVGGGR